MCVYVYVEGDIDMYLLLPTCTLMVHNAIYDLLA